METSVKAKIALALMIIGIAILVFNYFGIYFITKYLHVNEYYIYPWPKAELRIHVLP
jgi:hypothetical protein